MEKLWGKDDSLKILRSWADSKIKGYIWENGLLMHEKPDEVHGLLKRIVVPVEVHERVLELAHEHSGHLSISKLRALIARWYIWPGIHADITRHCAQCRSCQLQKRNKPKSAPNHRVPIITEPFEKIALDLVGLATLLMRLFLVDTCHLLYHYCMTCGRRNMRLL